LLALTLHGHKRSYPRSYTLQLLWVMSLSLFAVGSNGHRIINLLPIGLESHSLKWSRDQACGVPFMPWII
jgi:hypothetical protein